jgi:DNA-binding NarL/FixJ family response regulator
MGATSTTSIGRSPPSTARTSSHLQALDLASCDITPLTTRQHQLLTLLARGLTNAQIARLR